jgi:diguanylate cyclase (GGDEF)-like protein
MVESPGPATSIDDATSETQAMLNVVLSSPQVAPVVFVAHSPSAPEEIHIDVAEGVTCPEGLIDDITARALSRLVGEAEPLGYELTLEETWSVLEVPISVDDVCPVAMLVLARPEKPWTAHDHKVAGALAEVVSLAATHAVQGQKDSHQRKLDDLVAGVSEHLMGATLDNLSEMYTWTIRQLAEFLASDVAFLRQNFHTAGTSNLVAEWPPRPWDSDEPDPFGVVPFDSDPIFAVTRELKQPYFGNDPEKGTYMGRVEQVVDVPDVVGMAVPLLMYGRTWGVIGFIHFGLHTWTGPEVNAMTAVASMLVQVQGRFDAAWDASHDELTGMHNRRALLAELDERLEKGEPTAVMIIDLDRFKIMNDFLGHAHGDLLLTMMGDRIRSTTRSVDFSGRLGGDEFVFVIGGDASEADALGLAGRLLRELGEPTTLSGHCVSHTASIGVALAAPGMSSFDLLAAADVAMYRSKDSGGNRAVLFDDEMRDEVNDRSRTELLLSDAVASQNLRLCYQPIVDMTTGRMVAVEALVRWDHPERGLIGAAEFIPVAEESGMIAEIDRWVLFEACRQAAEWRSDHPGVEIVVGINISPADLRMDGFVSMVEEALARYNVPGSALCIEVTEHVVVAQAEKTSAVLSDLRALGVSIAIDDFGTGFASMAELKNLPANFLKLDMGFVAGILTDRCDRAIVESIIHLGTSLGMGIIAEGVETDETAQALIAMGCKKAQGYLFAQGLEPWKIDTMLYNIDEPIRACASEKAAAR